MSDAQRLAGYVDIWWAAVQDFLTLLDQVPGEEWATPTDLPGWTVHDVVAHTAHLEAVLAGTPEETLQIEPGPHVTGLMGLYTEQGVAARRDRTPAQLVEEIRRSTGARHEALRRDPPSDGSARPERIFGGVLWTWDTLLRNRPLDVWMHEQDVRRAVGRPGNLDSPAARHTTGYLAESLPLVVAKRAGAPPGSTVVLRVEGSDPVAVGVGEDGRGRLLPKAPAAPTVTLQMDRETFVVLAGGRRAASERDVAVTGDTDLAARVLAGMAVTP